MKRTLKNKITLRKKIYSAINQDYSLIITKNVKNN